MEDAHDGLEEKAAKLTVLRDKLIDNLLKIPHTRLNGGRENRLCTNVNISFEGIEGEGLLLLLDLNDIAGSSGLRLHIRVSRPVPCAVVHRLEHGIAHGSLRLSLGKYNTEEDVDYALQVIPQVVERLRDMSPVWQEMKEQGLV